VEEDSPHERRARRDARADPIAYAIMRRVDISEPFREQWRRKGLFIHCCADDQEYERTIEALVLHTVRTRTDASHLPTLAERAASRAPGIWRTLGTHVLALADEVDGLTPAAVEDALQAATDPERCVDLLTALDHAGFRCDWSVWEALARHLAGIGHAERAVGAYLLALRDCEPHARPTLRRELARSLEAAGQKTPISPWRHRAGA
jgi:hypothetical protein